MKKRLFCVLMVIVWLGLSVMAWPVSAEVNATSSSSAFNLSATKLIMGVGEVVTIEVIPGNVNPTWTTSNATIVSVNTNTGVVTALKSGDATITATYVDEYGNTYVQTCIISVLYEKVDVREGVYRIQYKRQNRYLLPVVSEPALGPYMRVVEKNASSALKWRIDRVDDYYTIESVQHHMYLGISSSNSPLPNMPTLLPCIDDNAKWRIFRADNGLIFVPVEQRNGLVLSPNGNYPANAAYIGLFDFFDKTFHKHWNLDCVDTYLVNYYDYSIADNEALLDSITVANEFISEVFDVCFSHNIHMDGAATYYEDLTCNGCTCGYDVDCFNSDDCADHHKNHSVYFGEAHSIPVEPNNTVIMWANHYNNHFCEEDSSGNHSSATFPLAYYASNRIVFNYFWENVTWDPDVPAALILAHEVGHAFGLPEMYELDTAGHSDSGDMVCVMQRYGRGRAEVFYRYLRVNNDSNLSETFCDDCLAILQESVDAS